MGAAQFFKLNQQKQLSNLTMDSGCIAVTGTDGKTTTTNLIHHILNCQEDRESQVTKYSAVALFPNWFVLLTCNNLTASIFNTVVPCIKKINEDFSMQNLEKSLRSFVPHKVNLIGVDEEVGPEF